MKRGEKKVKVLKLSRIQKTSNIFLFQTQFIMFCNREMKELFCGGVRELNSVIFQIFNESLLMCRCRLTGDTVFTLMIVSF